MYLAKYSDEQEALTAHLNNSVYAAPSVENRPPLRRHREPFSHVANTLADYTCINQRDEGPMRRAAD